MSAAKAAEANKAIVGLREAELAVAAARSKLDAADQGARGRQDARSRRTRQGRRRSRARPALAAATKAEDEARADEAIETPEALAAARAAWDAENASRTATPTPEAAERGTEPISIFVSKKTGRVYIRQAWTPIHEAPVTFKEPDIAARHARLCGGRARGRRQGLRWLSVTFPPAKQVPPRRRDDAR